MKKKINILYLLVLILPLTNCSVDKDLLENMSNDVMVIIDEDEGYIDYDYDEYYEYYIFDNESWDYDHFRLPYDDDLYGFELDIDGRVYPPETNFTFDSEYWYFYVRDGYNNFDVAKDEGIYYEYPSNRTFVFTAVWK